MPESKALMAPLLSPKSSPAYDFLVLRRPPSCDPLNIAIRVLIYDEMAKKSLRNERLMNPPAEGPRVIHKYQIMNLPSYQFHPLKRKKKPKPYKYKSIALARSNKPRGFIPFTSYWYCF